MLTNNEKKQIINSELRELHRQKYQLELACKVLKNTGQEGQLESRTNILIKTEEMIDQYNAELKELNAET